MSVETPSFGKKMRANLSGRLQESAAWRYMSLVSLTMPRKVTLAVVLMLGLSLTEGIGLVFILPLLQLVGIDVQQGVMTGVTQYIASFFSLLGLPVTLVTVLAVYVVIMSLYAFLMFWESTISYAIQFDLESLLRQRLYRAIINTSWLFFSRNRAAAFLHALTGEIDRVGWGTNQLLELMVGVLVVFVYLFIAWQISPIVTGVVVIAGILLLLVLNKKASLASAKGAALSVSTRDIYRAIKEHLDGMKTAKSYAAQEQNAALFTHLNEQIARTNIENWRNWSGVRSLFDVGSVLLLSVALVVLVEVLHLPGGTVLLMLYIFFRTIPRFSSLHQSYQSFLNMLPSFANVTNLTLECENEAERYVDDPSDICLQRGIEIRDVSFAYSDGVAATLDNITLTIRAGETTAIVGSSGAGKSTLSDLIMGLILPSRGAVFIDDVPLRADRVYAWRRRVGYVAQDTFLFNDTIRANLVWAYPHATDAELWTALRLASAEEFVSSLHEGIETELGDRGVRLSAGERQRLALARALLRKPIFLLLDEATSNLDSGNERRIQDAIDALHGVITIVIITHRLSTIRRADVINVLDEGHIVESGQWDSLLEKQGGRFRELCVAQGLIE